MSAGLIFAYLLDGRGGGRKLSWEEIKTWTPQQGVLWIHLNYAAPDAQTWLFNESGLDEWAVEALTEDDARARTIAHPSYVFTCLRCINLNASEEEEDMVSVRAFVQENLLITARQRELLYINHICRALEQRDGPVTSLDVISFIVDEINTAVSNYIDDLADKVDDIEEDYLIDATEVKRDVLADIRRQVLILKRHLTPQKEALKSFYTNQSALITKEFNLLFQEHYDTHARVVEELDLSRERCALLQEQISNRLSEQLNRRMYVFSMLTAIFLPITSIASLFGMNLGGIPGTDSPWGFGLVSFFLGATSLGLIAFLKRKKWF